VILAVVEDKSRFLLHESSTCVTEFEYTLCHHVQTANYLVIMQSCLQRLWWMDWQPLQVLWDPRQQLHSFFTGEP